MEGEVDPRPQLLKRYSAFDEVILQRSCRKLTFTVTDQSHDENDRSSLVAGASSYELLPLGCWGGLEPGPLGQEHEWWDGRPTLGPCKT